MEQFLAYGIVGLTTAAIYAVIGSGLVLTYTTTGVFNFAHGAAGMLAAFTYWQLTVGRGWPVPVALAVVLLVAAPAFGLGVERVLMRPIQGLGVLPQVCTSLGRDALSWQLAELAQGRQPMARALEASRAARAPLQPTQILAISNNCPAAEGREADLDTDPKNCGGCGKMCAVVPNGSANCINGVCAFGGCKFGWADCNNDRLADGFHFVD